MAAQELSSAIAEGIRSGLDRKAGQVPFQIALQRSNRTIATHRFQVEAGERDGVQIAAQCGSTAGIGSRQTFRRRFRRELVGGERHHAAPERAFAGEKFVQDHAERIDVRRRAHRLP